MADAYTSLVARYDHDIRAILWSQLESLKDDLRSQDKRTSESAAKEASVILAWLLPPSPPSPKMRLHLIEDVMADTRLSDGQRLADAKRALRSTGRSRGRPRDETSQHAIRAFTLRLSGDLSWLQIAMRVKGCKDKGARLGKSCKACGDSIRKAAGRLDEYLQLKGYRSKFPSRKELEGMSPAQLAELWNSQQRPASQSRTAD